MENCSVEGYGVLVASYMVECRRYRENEIRCPSYWNLRWNLIRYILRKAQCQRYTFPALINDSYCLKISVSYLLNNHWSPSNRPWWWPNRHKKTRKRAIVRMCKPMNFNWTLLVWRPSYPNPKDKREHCKMGKMDEWSKFRFQYSHNRFFFSLLFGFSYRYWKLVSKGEADSPEIFAVQKGAKIELLPVSCTTEWPLSCRVGHTYR